MKSLLLLFWILPAVTLASPYGFKKNTLRLFTEASTVTTTRNYDDSGTLYVLNSPNQLKEYNFDLGGSYDLNSAWGIHMDMNIRQVASQSLFYNYSNTGISDVSLGSDFLLFETSMFRVIPDLNVVIPLAGLPGTTSSSFISDGALAVTGLVNISSHFWIINGDFYGGYEWRSQGLSSQIPLGLMGHAGLGRSFFVDLKGFGEISMANDQYSSAPSNRNLVIAAYNGGSFLYDSVNPSFFAVKGSLGWNISRSFNISAGVRQTLVGYKVADETRFFVNLSFISEGKKSASFRPSRHEERDGDDNFQVDTEGE